MKDTLIDVVVEAYDDGIISAEDAQTYLNFVECADLEDPDDVDVLTEMVDAISMDDSEGYYESAEDYALDYLMEKCGKGGASKTKGIKNPFSKKKEKPEKKMTKLKAKIAANKGKIAAAAGAVAAVGGAAALGYAGGKAGSNKKIQDLRSTNDALSSKNDALKAAFKQANQAKRSNNASLMRASNELSKALDRNKELKRKNEELELLRKGREILFPVRQDERRDDVTSGKGVSRTSTYAGPSSLAPRSLAPSSSRPAKLTAADIAARRKPSQPSSSRPGRKPGSKPGRQYDVNTRTQGSSSRNEVLKNELSEVLNAGKELGSSARTLAPSSSRPAKLTAADIAARRKPSQPSSSRPGRKPGRR